MILVVVLVVVLVVILVVILVVVRPGVIPSGSGRGRWRGCRRRRRRGGGLDGRLRHRRRRRWLLGGGRLRRRRIGGRRRSGVHDRLLCRSGDPDLFCDNDRVLIDVLNDRFGGGLGRSECGDGGLGLGCRRFGHRCGGRGIGGLLLLDLGAGSELGPGDRREDALIRCDSRHNSAGKNDGYAARK